MKSTRFLMIVPPTSKKKRGK